MKKEDIQKKAKKILKEIPDNVTLVAAAKTRTKEEIDAAVDAGIKAVGHNYVKEAQKVYDEYSGKVRWHLIGHLQRNKVKKAVEIFDMIETLDSHRLARSINKKAAAQGKVMPVLIEVNSGREEQKYGILPRDVMFFVRQAGKLPNIKIQGLMTMGPYTGDPEDARKYFVQTRKIFEEIKKMSLENIEMKYLSMGMSNSYKVAIEEGANIVRIGSAIFGPRKVNNA